MPDDTKLDRLLGVIADLSKSTHMDGAVTESPFAAATEHFVNETRLELQHESLGEAAPETVNADAIAEDPKTRKAA